MRTEIPLLFAIEQTAHDDNDRMGHSVRIGIGGRADPPLTAEVESDFFVLPRIREITCDGGFNLPKRLRNLLVFKAFEALYQELGDDMKGAEVPVYDASRWIETQFLTSEAELLIAEFGRFVEPGKPINWRKGSMYIPLDTSDLIEKEKP